MHVEPEAQTTTCSSSSTYPSAWELHYIHRFSKQCNSLPNIVDFDVISAFLTGTSCKTLVHKLGC